MNLSPARLAVLTIALSLAVVACKPANEAAGRFGHCDFGPKVRRARRCQRSTVERTRKSE